MKYKVGDEVFVKAKIVDVDNNGYYARPINGQFTFWAEDENIVENPDMTAEEAWEIAKKIADMLCEESNEIFGTAHLEHILQKNTPQQAKAKIEAWEAEKEIKVGDEVVPKGGHYRNGERGLAVCVDGLGRIGVNHPSNDFTWYKKGFLKKTGRHIDIDGLLKQIGDEK